MKIENYQFPKSSFLSMEKDLNLIIDLFLKNKRLKKLLYYTTKDCMQQPDLTEEEDLELLQNNIRLVPKIKIDSAVKNYIGIGFDSFIPNATNPEFRDNVIMFDIICHFDQWQLKDFELRPYRIAGEIDSMLNDKHLTGIGTLEFLGAQKIVLTNELGGLCLIYRAVHGEEDKKNMPNPFNQQQFVEDFDQMFNNK